MTTNYYLTYYRCYDVYYFAEKLYKAVSGIGAGKRENIVMQFGDLFDYYKYEGNGVYSVDKVESDEKAKIVSDIKSYYQIDVNIHNGNMISASQSIFKSLKGSMNYNENVSVSADYSIGRSVLKLTEQNLKLVEINNNYYLTLNDKCLQKLDKYKNTMFLEIHIDSTYFNDLDVEIKGLVNISSNGFTIYKTNLEEREVLYV